MPVRILVAYASRKGSTAEIAQTIGRELILKGFAVDVSQMKSVASFAGYYVVVLGEPVVHRKNNR